MNRILKAEIKIPLVDRVIEQLRGAISSGKIPAGERLIECEIAEHMQVSRNAVREAFRSLEKEGFVTITPFKGAHVTIHTKQEIAQMFEVMGVLEGMSVMLAIRNLTPERLAELDALHEALEKQYAANEPQKYLQANWKFHEAVKQIAGNDILTKIFTELQQKTSIYRTWQLSKPNRFKASIEEHRLIMDAFHKKDPVLGEVRMREHLMRQSESLM
ncbi:MAG: GntR family transcriptional regulator [Proteobacteria bacterium]|nr:GntR family transcriptional regulator [Pseudomonadota bacterium]MBU1387935.1 GntR family transcriptional regulator [Pseudomonadota bacterium]MBU1541998.1 GntR family transcriptional regulator [Pseudomonadota bacterium]MBU2479629.1 GntR family transcriptional regulator [Pseudomonadota bacterium]